MLINGICWLLSLFCRVMRSGVIVFWQSRYAAFITQGWTGNAEIGYIIFLLLAGGYATIFMDKSIINRDRPCSAGWLLATITGRCYWERFPIRWDYGYQFYCLKWDFCKKWFCLLKKWISVKGRSSASVHERKLIRWRYFQKWFFS